MRVRNPTKKVLRERKATEASQVSFTDISFRAFQQTKGVKTSAASWRGAPVEFLLSHEEFPLPVRSLSF